MGFRSASTLRIAALVGCSVVVAACSSGGANTGGITSETTLSGLTSTSGIPKGTTTGNRTSVGYVVATGQDTFQFVDANGFDQTVRYASDSVRTTAERYLQTQAPAEVAITGTGQGAVAHSIAAGPNPYAADQHVDGTLTSVTATGIVMKTDAGAELNLTITPKHLQALNVPTLNNTNLLKHLHTRIYYVDAGAVHQAVGFQTLVG